VANEKRVARGELERVVGELYEIWNVEQAKADQARAKVDAGQATLDDVFSVIADGGRRIEAAIDAKTRYLTPDYRKRVVDAFDLRAFTLPEERRDDSRQLLARQRLAKVTGDVERDMRVLAPMRPATLADAEQWVERAATDDERDERRRQIPALMVVGAWEYDDPRDGRAIAALREFCQRRGVSGVFTEHERNELKTFDEHHAHMKSVASQGPANLMRHLDEHVRDDEERDEGEIEPHQHVLDEQALARGATNRDIAASRGETVRAVELRSERARMTDAECSAHRVKDAARKRKGHKARTS
jgi:hypothetical protein